MGERGEMFAAGGVEILYVRLEKKEVGPIHSG